MLTVILVLSIYDCSVFILVEEIFDIYKSVFYTILRLNRQVNLAI